ncbi:MAG TPA: YgjP-like metallopeptidase domain-containing protein [Candidatus Dormibacteraeota bacterium]|nr:YgjP-like metallopeptidase domain-containing protein [Candidatus Dormibacteraeota bacterium]
MPNKEFQLDELNIVKIYKHKQSRSLKLSLSPSGQARVSMPTWLPYKTGLEFARSRTDWLDIQRQNRSAKQLTNNQPIGKAYHLVFKPDLNITEPSARLSSGQVIVSYPERLSVSHQLVQTAAQNGSLRALRKQAEQLLPQRVKQLAEIHGFNYQNVRIKQLKGRWGSCDHKRNIVLNLFLMQLPWTHIDYVILHELTHTKILKHGPLFWRELEKVSPKAQILRQAIRSHQPAINS